MAEYNESKSRELDWDDIIENDGPEFVLLPAGDYDFKVTDLERGRHPGSEKLPPCNKAIISLQVTLPDGKTTTVKNNLFLHTLTEGLLCSFFNSIGQRQKGESFSMNWGAVIGSAGRAKIGIRKWVNESGEERSMNQVERFYDAPEKKIGYEAGRF